MALEMEEKNKTTVIFFFQKCKKKKLFTEWNYHCILPGLRGEIRVKYYSKVQYYHQEALPLWKYQSQQLMICDIVL